MLHEQRCIFYLGCFCVFTLLLHERMGFGFIAPVAVMLLAPGCIAIPLWLCLLSSESDLIACFFS